jgi:hypothetical protein
MIPLLSISPSKGIALVSQVLQVTVIDGVLEAGSEILLQRVPPSFFIIIENYIEITKKEPVRVIS